MHDVGAAGEPVVETLACRAIGDGDADRDVVVRAVPTIPPHCGYGYSPVRLQNPDARGEPDLPLGVATCGAEPRGPIGVGRPTSLIPRWNFAPVPPELRPRVREQRQLGPPCPVQRRLAQARSRWDRQSLSNSRTVESVTSVCVASCTVVSSQMRTPLHIFTPTASTQALVSDLPDSSTRLLMSSHPADCTISIKALHKSSLSGI